MSVPDTSENGRDMQEAVRRASEGNTNTETIDLLEEIIARQEAATEERSDILDQFSEESDTEKLVVDLVNAIVLTGIAIGSLGFVFSLAVGANLFALSFSAGVLFLLYAFLTNIPERLV